jgi:glucosamine-6-phosphate deaminase
LDRKTRADASSTFYGIENVPKYAITMGIGTILSAKKIIIAAFTEGKQRIATTVIEGAVSSQYPATFL